LVLHGHACSAIDIGFRPANALVRKNGGFGLDGGA
jgi:formylmethanofuran dehydrogenase subunit E